MRKAKAEGTAVAARTNRSRGLSFKTYMRRYGTLYLLLLLPIVFFIIFRYTPMAYILMAFKKNNIIQPPWFVDWAKNNGFEWFIKAFKDKLFIRALENTIKLNLLDLVCGFPAPIMNSKARASSICSCRWRGSISANSSSRMGQVPSIQPALLNGVDTRTVQAPGADPALWDGAGTRR